MGLRRKKPKKIPCWAMRSDFKIVLSPGCFLGPDDQTVSLALWAPTAQHVDVLIYEEPRGGLATVCPMLRGKGEVDDGVWRACGSEQWKMKYYKYRVKAFHPTTGQV